MLQINGHSRPLDEREDSEPLIENDPSEFSVLSFSIIIGFNLNQLCSLGQNFQNKFQELFTSVAVWQFPSGPGHNKTHSVIWGFDVLFFKLISIHFYNKTLQNFAPVTIDLFCSK